MAVELIRFLFKNELDVKCMSYLWTTHKDKSSAHKVQQVPQIKENEDIRYFIIIDAIFAEENWGQRSLEA